MPDFAFLANQCAPDIAPQILERLIKVESSFNPYAIGVVGGRLARQPRNKEEAVATALSLEQAGWNFSMGLGQVNRHNLSKYGLSYETVFEPCYNVRAAADIFNECLRRASGIFTEQQAQLAAFSCYYSGNFRRGFVPEGPAQSSYVERIMAVKPEHATNAAVPIAVISGSNARPVVKSPAIRESRQTQSGAKISHRGGNDATTMGIKTLRGD